MKGRLHTLATLLAVAGSAAAATGFDSASGGHCGRFRCDTGSTTMWPASLVSVDAHRCADANAMAAQFFATDLSAPTLGNAIASADSIDPAVGETASSPETYALILAGLGLVGLVAGRRKRRD